MKKALLCVTLAALTMGAGAQNATPIEKTDSVTTISSDQQLPIFPGGPNALKKYLEKNVKYPQVAEDYGVEGSVIMTFFIGKDGSLSDISAHDCTIERFNTTKFSQETVAKQIKLREQFALLFAKEGYRVIRKMPKWIPGKINGQAVRAKLNQRIIFTDPSK